MTNLCTEISSPEHCMKRLSKVTHEKLEKVKCKVIAGCRVNVISCYIFLSMILQL